jgi:hypothetical protein
MRLLISLVSIPSEDKSTPSSPLDKFSLIKSLAIPSISMLSVTLEISGTADLIALVIELVSIALVIELGIDMLGILTLGIEMLGIEKPFILAASFFLIP